MKAYLDFLAVVMMTASTAVIVGGLVVVGIMIYRIIKDDY
jgi:hypothetical protein